MSAKKATPAKASKPVPTAGTKSAGSQNGKSVGPSAKATAKTVPATTTARAVAAVAAPKERTLSNHDIGEVAGEVWAFLAANEAQTVAAIKKAVRAPADAVAAAIGWLAREGKLEFTTSGQTRKVSLKS